MTVRNREGLIKALYAKQSFTYGGHIEAISIRGVYHIKDYGTTMLIIGADGGIAFFNNKFYSNTTSKLQNLLKEVFNIVAPERKAYLFDTEPKKIYCIDVMITGKAFFNKNGNLVFFTDRARGKACFLSPKELPPLISLRVDTVWCDIETKLLRGED